MTDHRRPLRDDETTEMRLGLGQGADPQSCFRDEVVIDFPSIGAVVDRMRNGLLGSDGTPAAHVTAISVSPSDAHTGVTVPLDVPVRATCRECGGRGESWAQPCGGCEGSGERPRHHLFRLAVPAGVSDGTRLRFLFAPPQGVPTHVEVTVLVA